MIIPIDVQEAVARHKPRTAWEAIRIPGVGARSVRKLFDQGAITDARGFLTNLEPYGSPRRYEPSLSELQWLAREGPLFRQRRAGRQRKTRNVARDLRIIDECAALVRQFTRQYPGVAADFAKLRARYEKGEP